MRKHFAHNWVVKSIVVSVKKEVVKASKVMEKRYNSARRWHGNSYVCHILNICKSLLNLRKFINQRKLSLQQIRKTSSICLARNCSVCCSVCRSVCSSVCSSVCCSVRWRNWMICAGEILISDVITCTCIACVWRECT